MRLRDFIRAALVLGAGVLAGCSNDDVRLPGTRIPVMADDQPGPGAPLTPLSLGAAEMNSSWTHLNGTAAHRAGHPALSWPLEPLWTAEIGTGNSNVSRIIASPVIGNGMIYVQDAAARVTALTTGGAVVWSESLGASGEDSREGFGGGLALDGGRLFVTTGFGELLALDPRTGGILWRQDFSGVLRAAPTAADGMVFVAARDDVGYGVDADTGRLVWELPGSPGMAGFLGGASPAVSGGTVVMPFSSGQIAALEARTGEQVWGDVLAGGRRGYVRMSISDIAANPVIANGRVYASSQGGELAATDMETGERLWTLGEGAYGPVWPAGNSVFLVSDRNQLLRVSASDGGVIWRVSLPAWENPKKRKGLVGHFGPVLAGGQLIVAGGDGVIRSYDPVSGGLLSETAIKGGATAQPAVAEGVLYVLAGDGTLHAFH